MILDIVIGGLQKHQTPRNDGICPSLTAAMGMGGGQTPIVIQTNSEPRTYDKIAPTIREEREGLKVIEDAKTTRGADVVSTIRASYYKTGERNIRENIVSGKGYEGVLIRQATKEGSIKCKVGGCYDASYQDSKTRRGRVQEDGDVTPTIAAQGGENINYVETEYRIRKLTPKECWRLMGYTDEDFEKAHNAGVSNSQLYKQAGNAIVKQVLMAIFSQLNIKGVKAWNDMTETEKRDIIKKTTMAGE